MIAWLLGARVGGNLHNTGEKYTREQAPGTLKRLGKNGTNDTIVVEVGADDTGESDGRREFMYLFQHDIPLDDPVKMAASFAPLVGP